MSMLESTHVMSVFRDSSGLNSTQKTPFKWLSTASTLCRTSALTTGAGTGWLSTGLPLYGHGEVHDPRGDLWHGASLHWGGASTSSTLNMFYSQAINIHRSTLFCSYPGQWKIDH